MQRLLTGLQPSGALHIGNYFGALKPFVELSKEYESFLMIADYHALTSLRNPGELRGNIITIAKDYVAAGIDPEKSVIFKQSDVPEHTELAWIFQCLVTVPFLERAHAYKDKVAKGLEANAGLFAYPMLMAADILLYDTDIVPVGGDQRQHVEYAREAAIKFNNAFGETFKEPKEKILESVAMIPGTDGRKMSKSYHNTIPLFGTDEDVRSAVMRVVTDSTPVDQPKPIDSAVVQGYISTVSSVVSSQTEATRMVQEVLPKPYKDIKEIWINQLLKIIRPMREKRDSISDADAKEILKEGSERARSIASEKMADVRKKLGVAI